MEWVLGARGYIASDGSLLDQMARRVWERWWLERQSVELSADELVQRAFALNAASRPMVIGWPVGRLEQARSIPQGGWIRPSDLVPDAGFPSRWSPVQMACHAARWSREDAEPDLAGGLWWRLDERPDGGWAGSVTTNGRHRAFVAAILDIPVIPAAGVEVVVHSSWPFRVPHTSSAEVNVRPGDYLRQQRPPMYWSDQSLDTVCWLADLGLCAQPDLSTFSGSGHESLSLEWVDRTFPWVVAETRADVRVRLQEYEARFGRLEHADLIRT